MDLTQLRMFCLVAETGSVARAAELLQRVPSNLTTRLRQLEQELGRDLFIREKQRLRLSPVGHNFLCYAERILALSEEAISMTRAGEPTGNFALGTMESLAVSHLPALLSAYHTRYPAVSVALTCSVSSDIVERVRAGTLATALVDGPIQADELNGCAAFGETLVLVSALDHAPIAHPQDIAGSTLLAFRAGCAYRHKLETWFHQAGVTPGHTLDVTSYAAMLACVASGAGVALLPLSVLDALAARDRVQRHLLPEPLASASTWLIWRRDAFGPNVEAFKKLIIEQFDT